MQNGPAFTRFVSDVLAVKDFFSAADTADDPFRLAGQVLFLQVYPYRLPGEQFLVSHGKNQFLRFFLGGIPQFKGL